MTADDMAALRQALAAGPTEGPWIACGPSFGDPLPRWVRRHALLLVCLVFAGCTEPQQVTQKRGEARSTLFKECMELAAKMPRQADDDVADIVNACASQSWYMTNHIQ